MPPPCSTLPRLPKPLLPPMLARELTKISFELLFCAYTSGSTCSTRCSGSGTALIGRRFLAYAAFSLPSKGSSAAVFLSPPASFGLGLLATLTGLSSVGGSCSAAGALSLASDTSGAAEPRAMATCTGSTGSTSVVRRPDSSASSARSRDACGALFSGAAKFTVGDDTTPAGSIWKCAATSGSVGPVASGDGTTLGPRLAPRSSWNRFW